MTLVVSVRAADDASSAGEATRLIRDLVRAGVDANVLSQAGPEGSKSGAAVTAGSLVISGALSTAVLRATTQIVLARIRQGSAGQITVTDGDSTLSIENASPETEQALTNWLTSRVR